MSISVIQAVVYPPAGGASFQVISGVPLVKKGDVVQQAIVLSGGTVSPGFDATVRVAPIVPQDGVLVLEGVDASVAGATVLILFSRG